MTIPINRDLYSWLAYLLNREFPEEIRAMRGRADTRVITPPIVKATSCCFFISFSLFFQRLFGDFRWRGRGPQNGARITVKS